MRSVTAPSLTYTHTLPIRNVSKSSSSKFIPNVGNYELPSLVSEIESILGNPPIAPPFISGSCICTVLPEFSVPSPSPPPLHHCVLCAQCTDIQLQNNLDWLLRTAVSRVFFNVVL